MKDASHTSKEMVIFVTPYFNLSTTTSFVDPFRAANYLTGVSHFSWSYVSEKGGLVESSSGLRVETQPLSNVFQNNPWLVLASSSWAPEAHGSSTLKSALVRWQRRGAIIGGLDTGAIILARAGLLAGRTATVHYEHIDAFIELAPDTDVSEDLMVLEDAVFTCSGGTAASDLALHLLHVMVGASLSNACARYIFHQDVRGPGQSQNPTSREPLGYTAPCLIQQAIALMEKHLESPLPIPEIARRLNKSQRQLSRLFQSYVRKSPVEYYRDIRLDRARGLVTQTELKLSEIAVASGFNTQVHFSRAYSRRFGLSPSKDRIAGRVPFEFRAWPMHDPKN